MQSLKHGLSVYSPDDVMSILMKSGKVLIIEDEIIIAMEIEIRLKKMGYTIIGQVTNGDDAMKKIKETPPDIILMDIHIHGNRDGIEVAREIKSQFYIPIIYLTAHADDATLERAIITQPNAYLLKPLRDQELRANIELAIYNCSCERKIDKFDTSYQA